MIKKICFSILVILMLMFISQGIYEYIIIPPSPQIPEEEKVEENLIPSSTQIQEEEEVRENFVPFNFANFRSFDLIVVIIVMSIATTGISGILPVKKEGEKR